MKAILDKIQNKANALCSKEFYPLCIACIAFVFHALALDLVGILTFALFGAIWLIIFDNIKPVLPILLCAVFIVSTQNSPGYTTEGYYYKSEVYIPILVCAGILVLASLYRIARNYKNLKNTKLFIPIAILAVSFIMSGIGNEFYIKSMLFGAVQGVFLLWVYMLFSASIKKGEGLFDYVAAVLSSIAVLIAAEVVFVYFLHLVGGGTFDSSWKMKIITGWGVSNVAGELLVLLTVFSIYKMHKSRYKLFYELCSLFCMTMVVFCLNRAGILFGLPILFVMFVAVVIKSLSQPKGAFGSLVAGVVIYVAFAYFIITVLIKYTELSGVFDYFTSLLLSSDGTINTSGRFKIWLRAWEYFKSAPVWGVGYYQSFMDTLDKNQTVFMSLAHNAIIQCAMSGGVFGLFAFLYFLYACVRTVLKKYVSKSFVIIFCGLFFIITMFDTIYFIPYCTMFLMLMLVVVEKTEQGKTEKTDKTDKKGGKRV